jgi:ribosomal protein S18 acetylase RimI-like enzyme
MNDARAAAAGAPSLPVARGAHAFVVRPYRPEDEAAIRRLCCDTAFFGAPLARVFADGERYADLYVQPYLRYQPDLAFVAESQGRIVGYLVGAARPDFERLRVLWAVRVVLCMLGRYLRGDYRRSPDRGRFVRWLVTRSFRERPLRPAHCTAHLHFTLAEQARGRGLAVALWRRFEEALRARGVAEYYGEFLSCPGRQPERVYRRYGLVEYGRRRCSVFGAAAPQPVWLVCVHKRLAADPGERRPGGCAARAQT